MALKVRCFVDTNTTHKVIRDLRQLAQKWKDEVISLDPTGQPLLNVTPWISRATLDVIGEGKRSALLVGSALLSLQHSWF